MGNAYKHLFLVYKPYEELREGPEGSKERELRKVQRRQAYTRVTVENKELKKSQLKM